MIRHMPPKEELRLQVIQNVIYIKSMIGTLTANVNGLNKTGAEGKKRGWLLQQVDWYKGKLEEEKVWLALTE
jgi:hypothetical protein